jgi:hypothetical protein
MTKLNNNIYKIWIKRLRNFNFDIHQHLQCQFDIAYFSNHIQNPTHAPLKYSKEMIEK